MTNPKPGSTPGPATNQGAKRYSTALIPVVPGELIIGSGELPPRADQARIADLERQLSEAHTQLVEAMRTINDLSRASAEATRRMAVLAALQKQTERAEGESIGPRGRQRPPGPGFQRREIPQSAMLSPTRDVEAEFEIPAETRAVNVVAGPGGTLVVGRTKP